ncbi:MAG: prepilin peptidase [Alphaproteobacteria bacterium]|nr:prepilin peptidase [Alphaproteobacteria bacterium]MBV9370595.1 prepilin peptidase [Alphaproteobacteria bacterium]MBV9902567.1 prepilin peptidase [Alphaproteobacteria bacterium]
MPEGSAWTALGFVLGIAGGGALAAALRGGRVLAGRRCPRCGASLSLVPRLPILSWLAVAPRCRRCGLATPPLRAALEAGVVLIGVAAILLSPPRQAVLWAAGGWIALAAFVAWRRRSR